MKSKWIIAGVLIVVLIALCGASLLAIWQGVQAVRGDGIRINVGANTVSAKATEEKTLAVSGSVDLTVENDFGDVSVQNGAEGQVAIKAEKTAWGVNNADAQKALADLKVIIEQTGDQIKVSVQQPVEIDAFHFGPSGGSVKFTITVPENTNVTLRASNSDLTLTGTSGQADLHTDFGRITLTDVAGEVKAQTSNGEIEARNIGSGKTVALSSEFGNITADGVTGSGVTISSTNGVLELGSLKASGLLMAGSDFGNVHITDSQANVVDVRSNNGAVKLENLDVDGQVTVRSDFGDLTLTEVYANAYDLLTQNGKIRVDGARGSVKAHSDFGELEVLNAENVTLDLSSNNGGVTFSGSLGAGPHSLKSEFGNIKLIIPAEASLAVDLQTEFGKIVSDFEITVSGNMDEKHLSGKINGGGEDLTVKTNNGNITLQKSK
jgi:DUF4097 and DUF4098 domain-containing protein YvlB